MDTSFESQRNLLLDHLKNLNTNDFQSAHALKLQMFRFQYKYNSIYQNYCKSLRISPDLVQESRDIPFLPITAFKYHDVKTGDFDETMVFGSSGTTGTNRSFHFVRDLQHYIDNTVQLWQHYFASVEQYCFLALLPGYLDREGSSLISMISHFIKISKHKQSGFYLRNHDDLFEKLSECQQNEIPTVLFGVSHALLDFSEKYHLSYPDLMIMETGGMKGHLPEITKSELHTLLSVRFGSKHIHSEYGMTELMSQSYATDSILFRPNALLQVKTHQINDPLTEEKHGKTGIICVTDLANIDSCSFIQTEDTGILYPDGSFEIMGRLDASDIRGCNLLLEDIRS